jgi:membrane protein DedA with SNARE-associated domain
MLAHLVAWVLGLLGSAPPLLLYAVVALWIGVDGAGIPVPMEPVLLFTGALAADGKAVLLVVIASAALGALAFDGLAFFVGRRVPLAAIARVGRRVGFTQERADHLELWLRKRGVLGVVVAAVCPGLRTFAAYLMGAAEVSIAAFATGVLIGVVAYSSLWLALGAVLGANYLAPLRFLDRLGLVGGIVAVAVVVGVVLLHRHTGRLARRHVALHFHRERGQAAAPVAGVARPTGAPSATGATEEGAWPTS